MVLRTKERHLLVHIDDLGSAAAASASTSATSVPLSLSDVHHTIRDAVHRHVSGVTSNTAAGDAAAQSLQTKHYAPHAQLVMVRVPLAQSRGVREAIRLVKLSKQRPVQMSVIRAFGNAVVARRELARRLEAALHNSTDGKAQKRIRSTLDTLLEFHKR